MSSMQAVLATTCTAPPKPVVLGRRPFSSGSSNSSWLPHRPASTAARLPASRRTAVVAAAASNTSPSGPAYHKYLSRSDIEREYFEAWNQMTVVAQREGQRRMTALTLLAFLPAWFKFFVIPGPLRYVLFLVGTAAGRVLHAWRKRAVLAGAKLDAALMRRSSQGVDAGLMRKTALQRLHGTRGLLDLRYRTQLLRGEGAVTAAVAASDKA